MADVLERLTDDVIGSVRGYLARSVAPILARLEALEKRAPEKGDPGLPGKDGESVSLAVLSGEIAAAAARAVEALPKPADGKDFDPQLLEAAVQRHVAAIPKPKDGENGKDADPKAIAAEVMHEVAEFLDAIPVPKDGADGTSVSLDQVRELVAEAMKEVPVPKDGRDGKDGIGIKGDRGDDGEPARFTVSEGPPMAAGKAGEVYLDVATGDLYRCA